MEGKGDVKAGTRRVHAPGDVPGADRRAERPHQPGGAGRGGARRVLRDGAQRHGRPEGRLDRQDPRHGDGDRRQGRSGIKLTTSKLKVVAEGLQGIDKADFAAVAKEAEGGCPISNALRGTMEIELETEVR